MKPNHFEMTESAADDDNEFLLTSPPTRFTITDKYSFS